MKKSIALVFVLSILLVSILTGCASQTPDVQDSDEKSDSVASTDNSVDNTEDVSEEEALNEIDDSLVTEDEEVEIGQMI